MKNSEKSVVAVVGSYLLSAVLVQATDPLLSRIFPGEFVWGRVPSDAALIASTALFVLVSVLCAWLCAHFAPGRVARHVLWFFVVGEAITTLILIHNWTQGWPLWYWLSWPLTWPVSCWIGLLLAQLPKKPTVEGLSV